MMDDHRAWMSPDVRQTSQLTGPSAIHCPQSRSPQLEQAIKNGRPRLCDGAPRW